MKQLLNAVDAGPARVRDPTQLRPHVTIIGPFRGGLDPVVVALMVAPWASDEVGMLEEKTQELMVNMQAVLPLIVTNALSALGAIVILLIGLWLSGKADQLVVRVLSRTPHFEANSTS